MASREQELATLESDALRIESIERAAERCFDATYEAAEREGEVAGVVHSSEFRDWMTARANTDAAWGRWAARMQEPAVMQ